jgi:outer membrane protein
MKKIVLIAFAALFALTANAQDLKFAYVDFAELVQLMPEMDEARAAIEENSKANEEILMEMYEEYQSKGKQYQQNQDKWSPAILESKQKELVDLETRLQQTQQSLQSELQQVQARLQAPIVEKAQKIVNELAAAKGVVAVFEKSQLLYVDPLKMVNLTPEARTALNIPEGRTLEQLQQELQAKAQAQAAAQQGR